MWEKTENWNSVDTPFPGTVSEYIKMKRTLLGSLTDELFLHIEGNPLFLSLRSSHLLLLLLSA